MKCDICEEEKEGLIPFYWGFFKSEYEPEKWVMTCLAVAENFKGLVTDIHTIGHH